MADQVQFGADASQYFDVVARMQQKLGELEGKLGRVGQGGSNIGDGIGEGILRSERRVASSTANMVQSLVQVRSASDAVAVALGSVERSTKLGYGIAVGAAVGIAAYEALAKAIEHSQQVHEAADKALSRPVGLQTKLDPAGISREYDSTAAALVAEQAQNQSFPEAIINTFTDPREFLKDRFGLFQDSETRGDKNFDREMDLNKRLDDLAKARGASELQVAQAKEVGLNHSRLEGEILAINAGYAAKIAALRLDPKGSAGFVDSSKAAKLEHDTAIAAAQKRDEDARAKLFKEQAFVDFRGPSEEKTQLRLKSDFDEATTKNLKVQNDLKAGLFEKDQASLELAKAKAAIEEHSLELEKQRIQSSLVGEQTQIKVSTAQRGEALLGPDYAQRLGADSQIEMAGAGVKAATDALALDKTNLALKDKLTQAVGEQNIAIANKAKLENEIAQRNGDELNASKAQTAELLARAAGNEQLAKLIGIREAAEQRVTAAIRNGNEELAKQAEIQGRAGLILSQAEENVRRRHLTPEQRAAEDKHNAEVAAEVRKLEAGGGRRGNLDSQLKALSDARAKAESQRQIQIELLTKINAAVGGAPVKGAASREATAQQGVAAKAFAEAQQASAGPQSGVDPATGLKLGPTPGNVDFKIEGGGLVNTDGQDVYGLVAMAMANSKDQIGNFENPGWSEADWRQALGYAPLGPQSTAASALSQAPIANDQIAGKESTIGQLAGQDFSSLASLANKDFSGLAQLADLKIAIA